MMFSIDLSKQCRAAMLGLLVTCGFAIAAHAESSVQVRPGQKVAFLGDSITNYGATKPHGYVRLAILGMRANGVNISSIPSGQSGNKSTNMLQRVERDVLEKKPDWVVLSCGVNDVWHGERGVPLENYRKNISEIVDKCYRAGAKVMILTATPIGEELNNDFNKKLADYNVALHEIASEKGCLLADLNRDMREAIASAQQQPGAKGYQLTVDGVHMNPLGNRVMAQGLLRGFGFSAEQVQRAREAWDAEADPCDVTPRFRMSFAQYERLMAAARKQGKTVDELANEALAKAMETLVAPESETTAASR